VFYNLLAAVDGNEPSVAGLGLSSSSADYYNILGFRGAAVAAKAPPPEKAAGATGKKDYLRQYSATTQSRLDQFQAIERSMRTLGYSDENIVAIWQVLGAILELGNIEFIDEFSNEGEKGVVQNTQHSVLAARLLGVTEEALVNMLTQRQMTTGRETYVIPLRAKDAENGRAALSKSLYASLFSSIVASINLSTAATPTVQASLDAATAKGGKLNSISVLDIFGFESFVRNEFEQLLINYANEALQSTFNEQVFNQELKLFAEEHITTTLSLDECPSNQPCVDLIYGPGNSIISILQTTSELSNASDDKFAETLHKTLGGINSADIRKFFPTIHPKDRKHMFTVNHFAGRVTYSVGDPGTSVWLTKNHDALPDGLGTLLQSSSVPIVASLAPPAVSSSGATRRPSLSSRKVGASSVATKFTQSMTSLCTALSASNCSFIRCIKPNKEQKAQCFDASYSLDQVRSLGLVQVCEVMKVGLPTRITYGELEQSLGQLVADGRDLFANETPEVFMGSLLHALDIPDEAYELGKTRIFFRAGQLETVDRILSTDFADDKDMIMGRLRAALAMREQAKSLIDGLNRSLLAAGTKFDTNRAQIESLEQSIDTATEQYAILNEACGPMRDAVERVMHLLSTAQLAIQDVEVNAKDLFTSQPENDVRAIKSLIAEAAAQLKVGEDLWKQVDAKSVKVEVRLLFSALSATHVFCNSYQKLSNLFVFIIIVIFAAICRRGPC
jgi:myosin heavy subunit